MLSAIEFRLADETPQHGNDSVLCRCGRSIEAAGRGKSGGSLSPTNRRIRIVISAYAHIDIPLYAIPRRKEFVTLAKASMERYGYDSLTEAVNMAERDAWTALPADKVLLAHRECNWMPSDPRPVKWFLGEVEAKGSSSAAWFVT